MSTPRFLRRLLRLRDEAVIAALGVFMLFIAVNTQTGWLYLVVAVLTSLLVVGFVGSRLSLRSLTVLRHPVAPAHEGDEVGVRLVVRNASRRPRFLVTVRDEAPSEVVVAEDDLQPLPAHVGDDTPPARRANDRSVSFVIGRIPAHASVTVSYTMKCGARGVRPFEAVTLESAFPLGLFAAERRVAAVSESVVYPRAPRAPRGLARARAAARPAGDGASVQRLGRSDDLRGMRAYQPGDDMRYVHWPTSARTGQIVVREHYDVAPPRQVVIIDRSPPSGSGADGQTPLDEAARVAAGLLEMAARTNTQVTFVTPDASGEGVRLENARATRGLDWLARLQAGAAPHWTQGVLAARRQRDARGGRTLVLAATPLPSQAGSLRLAQLAPLTVVTLETPQGGTDDAWDASARTLVAAGCEVVRHRVGDALGPIMTSLDAGGAS